MSTLTGEEKPLADGEVSIAGLDKAALLAALYNGSRPMGMGWLQAREGVMTVEQARAEIEAGDDSSRMFGKERELYFDYLRGRPLKVDLSGDVLRTWLYNRHNGTNAAERIVAKLRAEQPS